MLIPDDSNCEEVYNFPLTFTELKLVLSECRGSSPGPDNIHYDMIKNLNMEGMSILLYLYNKIWTEKCFPDSWKNALLIPILKPGKDSKLPTNYRPISLTNCLCKVLERIVNKRLIWFLENNSIFNQSQAGFRKNRSTLDNLSTLESHIMSSFAQNEHFVAVFFDIEKAYDTTWRYFIIQAMLQSGLKGNIVHFVQNFLSDRKFNVLVGKNCSSTKTLENGIPQGSVLSCSLFILVINSLFQKIKLPVRALMYADDLVIYYNHKDLTEIQRLIQGTLIQLQNWSIESGFKFSETKTKAMLFTRRRKNIFKPDLFLNGTKLEYTQQYKFLGMNFDPKLSWVNHVKITKAKATKSLNLLKMLSHSSFGSDRTLLLRIHQSIVLPNLDYGSILYSTANKKTVDSLNSVHNLGVRISTGAFKTSRVTSLLVDAGLPPLHLRRDKQLLNYTNKIFSSPKHPLYNELKDNTNLIKYSNRTLRYQPFVARALIAHKKYNLPKPKIDLQKFHKHPPWTLNIHIDMTISSYNKNITAPITYRQLYRQKVEQYQEHYKIYTDGSKIDDKTGCAFATSQFSSKFHLPDYTSVFTAELFAIYKAINHCKSLVPSNFLICTDSLSSLQSIKNIYSKHPLVQKIHDKLNLIDKNIVFLWIPSHVGIEMNETVDNLAKNAISEPLFKQFLFITKDLKSLVSSRINSAWNTEWEKEDSLNDLRKIKPTVKRWSVNGWLDRKDSIIITRLRIGHTRLTKSYHFNNIPPPTCACGETLTVGHIFETCTNYGITRRKYGITGLQNLNIESEINIENIIKFTKEIGIYNEI